MKEEKKASIRNIGILCLLAMLLVSCGKSVEQQIAEQLELGQQYLLEEEYEQAVVAFNKAIELEPNTKEAYYGLGESYEGLAGKAEEDMKEEQSSYYSQAEEAYLQVLKIDTLDRDACLRLIAIYENTGDLEKLAGLGEYYYGEAADENLIKKIERAKEELNYIQEVNQYENELKSMVLAVIADENYDFNDTVIWSDEFQELIKNLEKPVIFPTEDDTFIAVYPGGYIYYGKMQDGMRQGDGRWIYGDIKRVTTVTAFWENGKPNGSAVVKTVHNLDQIMKEDGIEYSILNIEEINLIDGVYEGSGSVTWIMEHGEIHEWDTTYIKGILQSIDGDIAAYCKNCEANLLVGDGWINKIEGID